MCKLCRDKDKAVINGKEYSADLAEYSKGFSDDSSENPKKAKRACDRAWVTAKQIENWSKLSTMTLNRRLRDLEECERIQSGQDFNQIKIADNNGRATFWTKCTMKTARS